jgi:hypothetical protein
MCPLGNCPLLEMTLAAPGDFYDISSKVSAMVIVLRVAFWVLTSCSLVGGYRRFGGTC